MTTASIPNVLRVQVQKKHAEGWSSSRIAEWLKTDFAIVASSRGVRRLIVAMRAKETIEACRSQLRKAVAICHAATAARDANQRTVIRFSGQPVAAVVTIADFEQLQQLSAAASASVESPTPKGN